MIDSATGRSDYTGNGSASEFDYNFKILDRTHLRVVVCNLDGEETVLDLDDDYEVDGVGDLLGGTVTLVANGADYLDAGTNELKSGFLLSVLRGIPLLQEQDIRNQRDFYPETHEDLFDRMVMVEQQLQDQIDRSVKTPETESGLDMALPPVATRAGNIMAFDSDGKPTVVSTIQNAGDLVVTPYIETLLDDVNAATARATLGFSGAGGTVAPGNIEAAAVTTAKLADLNVTTAKLAAEAVTIAKMREEFFYDLTTVVPQFGDFVGGADVSDATKKKKFNVGAIKASKYASLTTSQTLTSEHDTLLLSGAAVPTITIPSAASAGEGKRYKLIHNDSTATFLRYFPIALQVGDTFGGVDWTSISLFTYGEVLEIESDGISKWYVVGRKTKTEWRTLGVPSITCTAAFVFSWTGAKSIVRGDTYTDGFYTYTVTTTANTTSGTFSGPNAFPGLTGTLTRVTGTGLATIVYTSRTVTGQPIFDFSATYNVASYYRDGQYMYFKHLFKNSGTAGTSGSGSLIWSLPTGVAIHSSIPPYLEDPGSYLGSQNGGLQSKSNLAVDGTANYSTVYTQGRGLQAYAYSTTQFRMDVWAYNAGAAAYVIGPQFPLDTATTVWSFTVKIPIESWREG